MVTPFQTPSSIRGVRIWLSGAVPRDASPDEQNTIRTFVRQFAARTFQSGAHILHGSHPSLTPILLEEAEKHVANDGRKNCLTLAVSKRWSKDPAKAPVEEWRRSCVVYETPETPGTGTDSPRDDSLHVLRNWMADRCDVCVAVGGDWWRQVAGRAGVPIEAGLAMDRGLPCFLLGGLGGAAQDYVRDHPEVIRSLRNGFDDETNVKLAKETNADRIVGVICDQLARLPLVRGRASDGPSFRILALDGGGIKGAFTASVLATLEESVGVPITRQFDLIAGTSTGGILAIALGMGLRPSDILRFYREHGPDVFPIMRFHTKLQSKLYSMIWPTYSQDVLRRELERAYFPDGQPKVLDNSISRLIIPVYNAVSGDCDVLTTPHSKSRRRDASLNAADAALATAAAPTYFAAAVVRNAISKTPYFDGGVWANCPAMAAIGEAVCHLKVPLGRIDILSIGTTDEPFTVKSKTRAGWLRWGKTLLDLLLNAQQDASVRHAELLVGRQRFLRVNAITRPGEYELDGVKQIEDLIALGNRRASDPEILDEVKSRFLTGVDVMDWK